MGHLRPWVFVNIAGLAAVHRTLAPTPCKPDAEGQPKVGTWVKNVSAATRHMPHFISFPTHAPDLMAVCVGSLAQPCVPDRVEVAAAHEGLELVAVLTPVI